jgi:uncharacterized protein (DUF2164 family)
VCTGSTEPVAGDGPPGLKPLTTPGNRVLRPFEFVAARPGADRVGYDLSMPDDRHASPMRITLSPERRAMLVEAIQREFAEAFDEPVSDFRAQQILDFFVAELGPPVYNQGVRDASSYIADKLVDIEGEVFEREPR